MVTNSIPRRGSFNFPGLDTTPEELEFGLAMYAYQKKYHRRYPAWSEVLFVLKSLGYAKPGSPDDPPLKPPCPYGLDPASRPTLAEIEACS